MTDGTCTAYIERAGLCCNGFPQKPFCRGHAGCTTCGNITRTEIPGCLDDDFAPAHLINDRGYPIHVKEKSDG